MKKLLHFLTKISWKQCFHEIRCCHEILVKKRARKIFFRLIWQHIFEERGAQQCWNYKKILHFFIKISWKQCFHEIRYFHEILVNLRISTLHTVEITEIYSHWKKISSNHLFSKTVTFTKFLPKMWERIPVISTLCPTQRSVELRKLTRISWK